MNLEFSEDLRDRFPDLRVLTARVTGVEVEKRSEELESFREEVLGKVRESYEPEELKDDPTFRVYRDFFWEIDIDPTKTRPASEALVRRVVRGKSIPKINTLVDAYNLTLLRTGIPLAAFDFSSLEGELTMRFARQGEMFLGIGMDKPTELDGEEIVISDSDKLIAIYPYRDSEETKITVDTEDVLLMACGVPGIGEELEGAKEMMIDYVTKFCGGTVKDV